MKIAFEFELADGDLEPLAEALGCLENEIEARLSHHAKAALKEYVEAYVGRRAFNRGSDILEHRLALLIAEVFGGALPTERQISRLFQTTPATSRALLRSTQSKYRFQLREAGAKAAAPLLGKAKWDKDTQRYLLTILSENLLRSIEEALTDIDPTLKPVSRLAESVAMYEISQVSYNALCEKFGVKPVPAK